MRFYRFGFIGVGLLLSALGLFGEASSTAPAASPVNFPAPFAAVSAYADAHAIPLNGVVASVERTAKAGDLSVLLVTLIDGAERKQWIVELEVAPLSEAERAAKNPPPSTLYVSTGDRLDFNFTPIALLLRTHGPFLEKSLPAKVGMVQARALPNAEQLALGFNNTCHALLELHRYMHEHALAGEARHLDFASAPFSATVVEKTKIMAQEVGLTSAYSRAIAGSVPALLNFLEIAQQTSGISQIVWDVIDLPSAWSIMKNGGRVERDMKIQGERVASIAGFPGQSEAFEFPINLALNGQPALNLKFIVAAPRPPLLTTAGILALFADHPKNSGKHAVIQVIGTRIAD